MLDDERPEVLLIGGRAGVGKTTAGMEVSAQLQADQVAHALVEGDSLDQIFPAPPGDPHRSQITEANLAAMWRNYAAVGCRRLIYTNTVSILEPDLIARAMGGNPRVIGVLLTADDTTARQRLSGREIGSQFDAHVTRSAKMAVYLENTAPDWVHRIPTDGRGAVEIARDIIRRTGWSATATATPRTGQPMPELELIRQEHSPALLVFELENRSYFAASIPDRGDEFFAEFEARFAQLLARQAAGTDYSHVLVADGGAVVGRVNLIEVADGSAELGYRIAQEAAGKGLATAAVREVRRRAAEQYGLTRLRARVTLDNPASRKVLERNGFVATGELTLNDKPAVSYVCELR